MHARDAFVAKVPVDLVDPLQAAHHQALQVELGGDAQEEIEVEGVVVGHEGPGRGSPRDGLHHRGLDLDVAARIEEPSDLSDHAAPGQEGATNLRVGHEVHVALPIADLDVGEPVPLLGRRQQGLAEEGQLAGFDRELALAGAHHAARDPQEVAEVDEIEQAIGRLPHHVLAHVDLKPVLPVRQGGKGGLAVGPLQEHAPGDLYLEPERVQGFDALALVGAQDLAERVRPLVARRVDADA